MRRLLLLLLLLPGVSSAEAAAVGEPCHLRGHADPLQCLQLPVPLDPAEPDGERLLLHVTIAPALRARAAPDPLFVLAGGPGQAGSDIAFMLDVAFDRVRATRDIVLIDQRGTGRSGRLGCDGMVELDLADAASMQQCLTALDAPLHFYRSAHAAHDIEQVRGALGYRQINLWGGSYGTRLAQTYARLYPQHVRALILDSVAAPGQIIGLLGDDPQRALDALFDRCEHDAACAAQYPRLRQMFGVLDAALRATPLTTPLRHPRTAERIEFELSHARFVEAVRFALYMPQFAAQLPFVLQRAADGDWQPFAALLASQAEFTADSMALGLTLAVLCAEDLAHVTPAMANDEAGRSFLRGSFLAMLARHCPPLDLPAAARPSTTEIAAPALLLSGALDPVTPPSRAEAAARHMPRAQHLIAAHVGHGVSHLGCAPRLLRAFLDAPDAPVDGGCLDDIPLPSPMLGAAGPQP